MWTKNKTKCWFSLEKKLLWAMCVAIYAHFQPIVAFERRNCPGDFMVIKIGPWNIYESNMILISSKLRCFVPARHPLRGFVESTSAYWPNLALTYFNIEKHRTPVKKCPFDLDPDQSSFVAWPKNTKLRNKLETRRVKASTASFKWPVASVPIFSRRCQLFGTMYSWTEQAWLDPMALYTWR